MEPGGGSTSRMDTQSNAPTVTFTSKIAPNPFSGEDFPTLGEIFFFNYHVVFKYLSNNHAAPL